MEARDGGYVMIYKRKTLQKGYIKKIGGISERYMQEIMRVFDLSLNPIAAFIMLCKSNNLVK
jgi:hypothetical protein